VAVWLVAVAVAWRSADLVTAANRPWTRAWRILGSTVLTWNLGGLWFPFGAAYIATSPSPDPA
jgi:hypothetical protein